MLTTTAPTSDPPAASAPWRACAVACGLLALEVILIDRLVGEELLSTTEAIFGRRVYRKDFAMAVPAALAVLWATIRHRRDAYRDAPLVVERLVAQGAAFVALFGYLLAMQLGIPQSFLGAWPAGVVTLAFTAAWVASLGWLLPPGTDEWRTVFWAAAAAAFVAFSIAISDAASWAFWSLTHRFTEDIVEVIITPFAGAPIVRPAECVIGTEAFNVAIGAPCSGYQGIFLMIFLFAGYLWWFRRIHRFPQVLLIFPIGIVLSFVLNTVRIAALILVGIYISPQIAVDGFHSYAGWLAFLAGGLGTIWGISHVPFFTDLLAAPDPLPLGADGSAAVGAEGMGAAARGATSAPAICGPSVSACLFPFLSLLSITILTGAFSAHDSIDVLYPLRVIVVAAVLWSLRREYRWREATLSPVAVGIGVATCAVWMLLAPAIVMPDPEAAARQDPAQLGMLWGSAWLLMRLVGYTITVPIAEELAFRGFLARRLIGENVESLPVGTFTWLSFVASSAAFGFLHGAAWLPGLLAGMAFALALYHRRRLTDAIVAHATTNALIGFYAIVTGSWSSLG
ncbi:MAG: exosortase E/protease, VPEID-CTERM system [Planctomycetaceae bacterium]